MLPNSQHYKHVVVEKLLITKSTSLLNSPLIDLSSSRLAAPYNNSNPESFLLNLLFPRGLKL